MKTCEVNMAVLLTVILLFSNFEGFVLLPHRNQINTFIIKNHNTSEAERKNIDQRDIVTLHALYSHGGNTSLASVLSFFLSTLQRTTYKYSISLIKCP